MQRQGLPSRDLRHYRHPQSSEKETSGISKSNHNNWPTSCRWPTVLTTKTNQKIQNICLKHKLSSHGENELEHAAEKRHESCGTSGKRETLKGNSLKKDEWRKEHRQLQLTGILGLSYSGHRPFSTIVMPDCWWLEEGVLMAEMQWLDLGWRGEKDMTDKRGSGAVKGRDWSTQVVVSTGTVSTKCEWRSSTIETWVSASKFARTIGRVHLYSGVTFILENSLNFGIY